MKLIKIIFLCWMYINLNLVSFGQIQNINPDPEDPPLYVFSGEFCITPEIQENLYSIPNLIISDSSINTTLPYKIDNSEKIYFRDIFAQYGASCLHASSIGYIFTYEINRIRNVPSTDSINLYPTHYTYNLRSDFGNYSDFSEGFVSDAAWKRVNNGCPNIVDWGGMVGQTYTQWMTGYDKYYRAMNNRIESDWTFKILNEDSLVKFKHWINDHGEGDSIGGLVRFSAMLDTYLMNYIDTIPPESEEAGKLIYTRFCESGGHSMTIVGYNDSIKYDFNGDSLYTNNLNIYNDSLIDLKDWEIGAVKIADSGGDDWIDSGFIYVPYRLLAIPHDSGGIILNRVWGVNAKENHEAIMTFKLNMTHNSRVFLKLNLGISTINYSVNPEHYFVTVFNYVGDSIPMQGFEVYEPIELGLDLTNLLIEDEIINPCKFFLEIVEKDENAFADGIIHSLSLYDYRCDEEIEIPLDTADVLFNNNDTTRLVIYYNPIPLTIDFDTLIEIDAAVRCTTYVSDNSTLTFDDSIVVDFYKGTLIVEEGSTLVIGDNVTINSKTGNNKIKVYGEIVIGQNLIINSSDSSNFEIYIDNDLLDIAISGADFDKTTISGHSKTLTIDDSEFFEGGITYSKADIEINNSDFVHAYFKAGNGANKSSYCYITNSSFTFYNGNPVYINSYPQFKIDSCTIFENSLDGICIYYSGTKPGGNHSISYNTIEDNGQYSAGIKLYQSDADVHNNSSIAGNKLGILSLNNSNVSLKGNKVATSVSGTQYIHDNHSNQVYATQGAFPYYFSWNAVVDENNTVPLVYYKTTESEELDVRNNYWGQNFSYQQDFYPYADYIYIPVWNLGGGDDEGEAEAMYNTAQTSISNEDYTIAKAQLQQLVTTYPASKFAQAALRELFALEEYATDDYTDLKSYYNTEQVIQNNPDLLKLADYLANYCEIKLENYPTAISWFENVIQNPETIEDSVFAIIDLGYTYFLMENGGLKSAYTGNMPEHKPSLKKQFEEKRDYLLTLIFKDKEINEQLEQEFLELKSGELLQNIPNPFKKTTQIWYKSNEESKITIEIHNYSGKRIKVFTTNSKGNGIDYIQFNSEGLSPGVYFYSLKINGIVTDTKKMTILK